MSDVSSERVLVMLGLRLKGFGEPETVSSVHDLDPENARVHLEQLTGEGLVRGGEVDGAVRYVLTLEGRAEGERDLARELDLTGTREAVQDAYDRFLELNPAMLQLCTDWQVIDAGREGQRLNEHDDADYDAAVVARLGALTAEATPMLNALADRLHRYSGYLPRFVGALEAVRTGQREYFTKPMIASFHTVWFELHEDLLASLGVDRASEHRTD